MVTTSPYKGLMPYAVEDAEYFFGRDAAQEIISSNLMASKLTVLYGASGVGKSSVLHAGVIHRLRREARRDLADFGSCDFLAVIYSDWKNDPLVGLLRTIQEAYSTQYPDAVLDIPEGNPSLASILRAWTEAADLELLIILDQFEEYFLYQSNAMSPDSFAGQFPAAINDRALRANFMISLREDALSQLDRFKGSIPSLFGNYLRIGHLDAASAREAIVAPIDHFNAVSQSDGGATKIEDELVDAVLEQLQAGEVFLSLGGSGATSADHGATDGQGAVQAPYLQLVMARLWREEHQDDSTMLRRSTLDRLGGAERIVRSHLDSVMQELSDEQREISEQLFRFLVTPSGTKIAHTASDLAEYVGYGEEEVKDALDILCGSEARVLRPVSAPGNQPEANRYEIFHDVLAPAILDWRERYLRGEAERRGAEKANALLQRPLRLWAIELAGGAVLLFALYASLLIALNRASDPVFAQLSSIGREPLYAAAVQQASTTTNADATDHLYTQVRDQLLTEIEAGLIEVSLGPGWVGIVVPGDSIFSSGKAELEANVLPLLSRIGEVLNETTEKIVVTGHTDNVPARSLRFPSNWQLSQARAEAVAVVLRGTLSSMDRVAAEGFADTRPLSPNDSSQGRARNRRIEIFLTSGGSSRAY